MLHSSFKLYEEEETRTEPSVVGESKVREPVAGFHHFSEGSDSMRNTFQFQYSKITVDENENVIPNNILIFDFVFKFWLTE